MASPQLNNDTPDIIRLPIGIQQLITAYAKPNVVFDILKEVGDSLPAESQQRFFARLYELNKEDAETLRLILTVFIQAYPERTGHISVLGCPQPDESEMSEPNTVIVEDIMIWQSFHDFKPNVGPRLQIIPERNTIGFIHHAADQGVVDLDSSYIEYGNLADFILHSSRIDEYADEADSLLTDLAVAGRFHGKPWKQSHFCPIPELEFMDFLRILFLYLRTTPLDR